MCPCWVRVCIGDCGCGAERRPEPRPGAGEQGSVFHSGECVGVAYCSPLTSVKGLDTSEPILQLENYVFKGRYEGWLLRELSVCSMCVVESSFLQILQELVWSLEKMVCAISSL